MPNNRVAPPVAVPESVRSLSLSELSTLTTKLGKCRDHDPEFFFPLSTPGSRATAQRRDAESEARTLCRGCPVTAECLEQALRLGAMHGVWGGTREWERAEIIGRGPANGTHPGRDDDGTAGRLVVAA